VKAKLGYGMVTLACGAHFIDGVSTFLQANYGLASLRKTLYGPTATTVYVLPGGTTMRLNEYELQFLHRLIGGIDIRLIPTDYFVIAAIMHQRLADALKAIQNRRLRHDCE
jgi:hypothetical protein